MFICKRYSRTKQSVYRVACACLAAVLLWLMPTHVLTASAATVDERLPAAGGIAIPVALTSSLPTALTGTSARAAVLIEAESGDIVFRQNERARLPMASTTKIMTALVAIEALPLDTPVTVTPASVGIEGSSIYLTEGETLTLEELLYALLLESANDAAATIAVAVSGSVEAFAVLMNEKAASLGLSDTHFVNPHGLDDADHYTTAYELAIIARAALQNEDFRRICSTTRKTIPLRGTEGVRLLLNHNKLLKSYDGCIGVKTGFTKKTGRCLVSATERDGVTLIAVTLGAPDDWRDHTAMLDYGFELYESVELCAPGSYSSPLWLISGQEEYVMVENIDALAVTLRRDHGQIDCVVELRRFDFAPIVGGQEMGQLVFYEINTRGERQQLGSVSLYAAYGVEAVIYKQRFWERLFRSDD